MKNSIRAEKPGHKSVFGAIGTIIARLFAVLVRFVYVYRGIVMALCLGYAVASGIFGEWENAGKGVLALLFFAPEISHIIKKIKEKNSKEDDEQMPDSEE